MLFGCYWKLNVIFCIIFSVEKVLFLYGIVYENIFFLFNVVYIMYVCGNVVLNLSFFIVIFIIF